MRNNNETPHWWRTLLMIPIAVFAIVSILATGHDDSDDPPVDPDIPGTLQLAATSFETGEGTVVNIIVTRSGGSSGAASVDYATADGTAVAGSDYTGASGTLTWADGVSGNQTISIAISDDGSEELPESFTVTLSNVSGATLGANSSATVNILDDGAVPPIILSSYNYEIGSLLGDVPFEASVGGALSIAVDFGNTLMGVINLDVSGTGDVNLVDYTIDSGSTMSVTVTAISEPQLNGTVAINVTEAVNSPAFSIPTAGAFEIVSTLGTILVDIGASGVELSLDGGTPESFTWDAYTDLLDDDGVPDWQRVASLGGGLLEFVYEYFLDAADLLDELELVTLNNPTTDACEMFQLPPMGVPEVGEVVFTWTGSGELLPGQNFEIALNNCWDSDFEELTNGNINLTNYVEVIDSGNTLTSIGFAPEGTTAGGVTFVSFTVAEAQDSGGTINPLDTVTVSGGFSLLFTAP